MCKYKPRVWYLGQIDIVHDAQLNFVICTEFLILNSIALGSVTPLQVDKTRWRLLSSYHQSKVVLETPGYKASRTGTVILSLNADKKYVQKSTIS